MDENNSMNYDFQPAEEPEKEVNPNADHYQPFDPEKFWEQEAQRAYYYAPTPPPEKPRKNRTGLKIFALMAAVAILGSVGGALLTKAIDRIKDPAEEPAAQMQQEEKQPEEKPKQEPSQPQQEEKAPQSSSAGQQYEVGTYELPAQLGSYDTGKSLSAVQVYELAVNSVVGIRTESTVNVFGYEAVAASAGSGFILSADGFVLTNAHVVSGAQSIWVDLFNGERYEAKLIGADSDYDIAVLKVEAEGLQPVGVGDSSKLKVGEGVVAIGNPLGELTFTMTNGILSALDREINTDGNPQKMLQTNAAINSGNSGGPLFDMDGNVIGVTTIKFSGSSSSGALIEGLGFAIPINTALKVAYDLVEYGYVRGRAFLGITVTPLDSRTASYYGLPAGSRVEQINEGSCAEKSGMQVGDIIIEFNGEKTKTYTALQTAAKRTQAGDTVTVKVYRDGEEVELTVTLDERPREEDVDAQVEEARKQMQQPETWSEAVPNDNGA